MTNVPIATVAEHKMSSSLPPLNSRPVKSCSLELPFKPLLTKAEKYTEFVRFDRLRLKREQAHFRNALKTTAGLEDVARNLNKGLSKLEDKKGKKAISFDRLAVCREAFEKISALNRECAPELQHIMDVYNEYVLYMMSKQSAPRPHRRDSLMQASKPTPKEDREFDQLKHKLHQLEVKVRVSLQEHEKLTDSLKKTTTFHSREMSKLHNSGQARVTSTANMIAEKEHSNEYLAHQERLHLQIAEKQKKIAEEKSKRKGSIPMSVYHNIEQCLREVEMDTQKAQRKNQLLKKKIKKSEEELLLTLQHHRLQLNGDLRAILGFQ